jgi:hypothetical protein
MLQVRVSSYSHVALSALSLHAVSLDASSGRQDRDTWRHVARRGRGGSGCVRARAWFFQFVVVARPPLLRCARERVVCMRMPVRVRACGSVCAFHSLCLCVGECVYGGVWVCIWEFVGARVCARACTLADSLMSLHMFVRAFWLGFGWCAYPVSVSLCLYACLRVRCAFFVARACVYVREGASPCVRVSGYVLR